MPDSTDALVAAGFQGLEVVGRGASGVVFRAHDETVEVDVALKVLGENLKDNETAVKYFLREARAAAAMSHPNIVTVFDAGEQDAYTRPLIALEPC